jgi:hypothetical protein
LNRYNDTFSRILIPADSLQLLLGHPETRVFWYKNYVEYTANNPEFPDDPGKGGSGKIAEKDALKSSRPV